MNLTNLNTFSTIIFLIFLIVSVFLFYRNYKDYKKTSDKYRFIATIFLISSFLFSSIAIFWIKVLKNDWTEQKWTNVVFVLDVSKSMNAVDFNSENESYSRLVLSKKFISDFVIKNPWNRYALVVFAWEIQRVLPFTTDSSLFLTILSWVDENNVSKQWTNLFEAINWWLKNFSSENNSWLLVLVSDWDDEKKINFEDFKNLNNDIKFLIVWVWTSKWVNIPTWVDVFWRTVYKIYQWKRVITKLEEENLKSIANIFQWEYFSLNQLDKISKLDTMLSNTSKKVFFMKSENFVDATRWIVMISFIFFIIYMFFLIKLWWKKS